MDMSMKKRRKKALSDLQAIFKCSTVERELYILYKRLIKKIH